MLDKIPASLRHTFIVFGAALITWLSQVVADHSSGSDQALTWQSVAWGVLGAVVAQLALWITPLTRQYGVGAPPPAGEPVINPDAPPQD